ncbi:ribosome biogenesis GTP-binding protein YsxC [Wolbachia pipientis]|uniref:Probable GTP-binding protein EngB n=1 Tax=Wolbachia pipientis TaxID=955 RepID=A0A1E7QK45_WOLPI|nr:ribosome biogenesis GTP-binding protein YihA/YsxC [Wolbachia pipientis]OEY86838.1 ribosome biogenesis GTP-binding protein YsxC [Wolbachia pipientis]
MKQDNGFIFGASDIKLLPNELAPEVAFAGRSNVGKSSLINALINSKKAARVSSNPGCTRQINFYSAYNHRLRLVDLPGYGYSRASKKEIVKYLNLVEHYLFYRRNLKKVFVLVDGKVGLKEIDKDFIYWLTCNHINFDLILTKIDKMSIQHLHAIRESSCKWINNQALLMHEVSSYTSSGIKNLKNAIYKII